MTGKLDKDSLGAKILVAMYKLDREFTRNRTGELAVSAEEMAKELRDFARPDGEGSTDSAWSSDPIVHLETLGFVAKIPPAASSSGTDSLTDEVFKITDAGRREAVALVDR